MEKHTSLSSSSHSVPQTHHGVISLVMDTSATRADRRLGAIYYQRIKLAVKRLSKPTRNQMNVTFKKKKQLIIWHLVPITPKWLSLPDNWALTQLIFLLRSSDLLREERARLLEKPQSMNGRLFPAVHVHFILATVVRHRDRESPETPTRSSPSAGQQHWGAVGAKTQRRGGGKLLGVSRRQTQGAFSFSHSFFYNKFQLVQMRSQLGARILARSKTTVFYFRTVLAPRDISHARMQNSVEHTKNGIQAVKLKLVPGRARCRGRTPD